jgi:predicted alpha/beta superfamily hydrolase
MKPISKYRLIAFILIILMASAFLPKAVWAQEEGDKIYLGELHKLQSQILGEERVILVYTPTGYQSGDDRYPVMYLLDGTAHFHHVTGIVDFMTRQRLISPMIVVALVNTDRVRDFTPTQDHSQAGDNFSNAGGAQNFLSFLSDELIPHIDKNYRTQDYRILVGHSFGGLFAVDALLTRPEVFNGYIAISPTFWWNDSYLSRLARISFKENPDMKDFLYVTMGNEGERMMDATDRFMLELKDEAPSGLDWHYEYMPKENHTTTPHRSIYNALEVLYKGWQLPVELLDSSVATVEEHYNSLSDRFGYEIDIPEMILNLMGYQALGKEDYERALKIFKLAVKKYPRSPNVYDSLGEGYEAIGEFEEAKLNFQLAIQRGEELDDPNLPTYRFHLESVQKKITP